MTEREQVKELLLEYLSLKENTPIMQRDGEECKAYHRWYDNAYAYFKSFDYLKNDPDFQLFINAGKDGNCFVLEHIYDTISPSYKVLMQKTEEMHKTDTYDIPTKTPMVFISHSSQDKDFVEALVSLLESIGFDNTTLFCSSIEDYWIDLSQNIFDRLRELFHDHELFVIFIQSPRYYESAVSLNEMGASWVLKTDYCSILTSDMTKEQMKGVVDSRTIFIKVNTPEAPARMNELRKKLSAIFNLATMSDTTWERKRNIFLKAATAIDYSKSILKDEISDIDAEYKKLQIEKLKIEEMDVKRASVRGNIIDGSKPGMRKLKIFNSGKSTAHNVNVEWLNPNEETFIHWQFGLLGELTPQNSRSYDIALCKGHFETVHLRYTWDDDIQDKNEFEEELQL